MPHRLTPSQPTQLVFVFHNIQPVNQNLMLTHLIVGSVNVVGLVSVLVANIQPKSSRSTYYKNPNSVFPNFLFTTPIEKKTFMYSSSVGLL